MSSPTPFRQGKQFVPENVLKKRQRDAKVAEERTKLAQKRADERKGKVEEYKKRAEKYAKLYKERESHRINSIRKVLHKPLRHLF